MGIWELIKSSYQCMYRYNSMGESSIYNSMGESSIYIGDDLSRTKGSLLPWICKIGGEREFAFITCTLYFTLDDINNFCPASKSKAIDDDSPRLYRSFTRKYNKNVTRR